MAQNSNDGCGALMLVGIVAFVLGGFSATDAEATTALAPIPQMTGDMTVADTAAEDAAALSPADYSAPIEEAPPPPRRRQSLYGGGSEDGGSTYCRNCSAARAAGAAPVRDGDPGYGGHLDRDNDGVGCE